VASAGSSVAELAKFGVNRFRIDDYGDPVGEYVSYDVVTVPDDEARKLCELVKIEYRRSTSR